MSPQLQSPGNLPNPSTTNTTSQLYQNRYPLLITSYLLLTSTLIFRVSRAPIPASRKWEQYETIFKGTTLGAVVLGVAIGGGWNLRRSEFNGLKERNREEVEAGAAEVRSVKEMSREEARKMIREGGVQRD